LSDDRASARAVKLRHLDKERPDLGRILAAICQAGVMPSTANPERVLRRDAEVNRQRVLAAARGLFAERGLDVTLHDVAHRAGVGVGTVYRRFANRDELLDSLFEESVERLRRVARAAGGFEDPWAGFVYLLEHSIEMMAEDRGLWTMATSTPSKVRQAARAQEHFWAVIPELVRRAQLSGALRADLTPSDIGVICIMVGTSADLTRLVDPGAWRRYLALLLDGLRSSRVATTPMPAGALTEADYNAALHSWRPGKR
jgi:AcrR family transcriptional regulator